MTGYKGNDAERPEYQADLVIDMKQKSARKKNVVNTYFRRLTGELPTIIVAIAIVILCFWGYYRFSHDNEGSAAFSLGSSLINASVIIVLGVIYRALAVVLVNWENHKYSEDWENSLISKNFAF